MSRRPLLFCLAALPLALACGRTTVYRWPTDASVEDAGVDAGVDAGFDAGTPDAGPKPCIPGMLTLTPATPVVMFVLDRSRSMQQGFGGTTSRWAALNAALARSLPPVDDTFETGMLLFPTAGSSEQCLVPAAPELAPAKKNVQPMLSILRTAPLSGSTPTAPAIDVAAAALSRSRAAGAARALVLATDGAPSCNGSLDGRTCTCISGGSTCNGDRCLDDVRVVTRLRSWLSAGLPTYVIGIQSPSETEFIQTLNDMAVAGGRPQSGARRYYQATSQSELDAAFLTIRQQVASCRYLSSSVPETDDDIELTVEGQVVPADAVNGWSWFDRPNGELSLNGAACQRASMLQMAKVTAVVQCPGPEP